MKYRSGIGTSEPEDHEYIRTGELPEVDTDEVLYEIGKEILRMIENVPEDRRY